MMKKEKEKKTTKMVIYIQMVGENKIINMEIKPKFKRGRVGPVFCNKYNI